MQKKTLKKVGLSTLGIVGLILGFNACGAEAPAIGENYCPDIEDSTSPSATIGVVASSSSTTGGGVGGASGSATASTGSGEEMSTGSGMEEEEPLPEYDVPAYDEIMSRLHSCHKLTYVQLGNFLRARGVAIPQGGVSDIRTTMTPVFGQSVTLGSIFGGSGSVCEMAITESNGTNDPICPMGEVCFCNQDDKLNQVNRSCLDVGNNSPDAADGYCVSKPSTAGYLYFAGKDSLGVPKQDSRLGEKEEHSTASAMKMMDIFIQSAPQIVANIGDPQKAPACTLNGKNYPMFAGDNTCIEESVSCLIGTPATDDHMLLCNLVLQKAKSGDATDMMKKKNMAVALLLAAAHSCQ